MARLVSLPHVAVRVLTALQKRYALKKLYAPFSW